MNATTILCILLLSLYLVLAVFWIVRSIIDTIDDRKREKRNGMIQQMIRQNASVAQDQTEYNQRFDSLSQKFKEAEAKKDAVAQQISDIRDRRGTMEDFLRILKQQDDEVTVFNEKLWCGLLDYARPTRMAA